MPCTTGGTHCGLHGTRADPLYHEDRTPGAERDPIADPHRHRLPDAVAVQEGAVLASDVPQSQPAAGADGQLGVDARHDPFAALDGPHFAFLAAADADAGALCLEPLARRRRDQGDPVGACLRDTRPGIGGLGRNRDLRGHRRSSPSNTGCSASVASPTPPGIATTVFGGRFLRDGPHPPRQAAPHPGRDGRSGRSRCGSRGRRAATPPGSGAAPRGASRRRGHRRR